MRSDWVRLVRQPLFGLLYQPRMMISVEQTSKQTPWPESASELCLPSDRRLSTKLVPTFADRWCHVVTVTESYGRNLDCSRWNEWQEKPKYSEKTCPSVAMSAINTTWPVVRRCGWVSAASASAHLWLWDTLCPWSSVPWISMERLTNPLHPDVWGTIGDAMSPLHWRLLLRLHFGRLEVSRFWDPPEIHTSFKSFKPVVFSVWYA
jgi:hypothetical protein